MKFRNKSSDDRYLPALGQSVEAGGDLVVTADEAVGLVHQCVGDGAWLEPADEDAQAAVDAATAVDEDDGPPAKSANKAEWVGWAIAQGDADAESKSKTQLIEEYGPNEESA